jgi:hypothetical protein
VACSTAYKWVRAITEGILPKVTLMNKCANIPFRKIFMCQFGIYLHKDIIIKPHYIFSYLLKLVA